MIEWIIKNKEWVFSGVGIAIASLLFLLLRRIISVFRSVGSAPPPFDQGVFRTRPFPAELFNKIREAPMVHQDSRGHECVGLKVQWRTVLKSASQDSDGIISLMLLDRGHYPWVQSKISKDSYPDLLLAKEGATIWIAGTIASYSSNVFTIEDAQLRIVSSE